MPDLEHPSITQTIKNGYPTGGKPIKPVTTKGGK
jgi:hypothetical protein